MLGQEKGVHASRRKSMWLESEREREGLDTEHGVLGNLKELSWNEREEVFGKRRENGWLQPGKGLLENGRRECMRMNIGR